MMALTCRSFAAAFAGQFPFEFRPRTTSSIRFQQLGQKLRAISRTCRSPQRIQTFPMQE